MIKDLIKGLELNEEQLAILETNFTEVKTNIEEFAQNDKQLISDLKTGAFAEATRKFANALGLDKNEIEGLKIDDVAKLAKAKLTETSGATESEIKKENVTLKQRIQEFETEILPQKDNEVKAKIKQFQIETKLADVLSGIETISTKQASKTILQARLAEYNIDLDDSGNVTVQTKDGLKPTIDNKIVTDITEISKHILTQEGLVKLNNNGATPQNGNTFIKGDTSALPKEILSQLEEIKNMQKV